MSECPGLDLEDYVKWEFDIRVESTEDANVSLQLAELIGTSDKIRPVLSARQFRSVMSIAEHRREAIESWLFQFNDETQSWRGYAGSVDWFTESEIELIHKRINGILPISLKYIIVKNAAFWEHYWENDPRIESIGIEHSAHGSFTAMSIKAKETYDSREDAEEALASYNSLNPSGFYDICLLKQEYGSDSFVDFERDAFSDSATSSWMFPHSVELTEFIKHYPGFNDETIKKAVFDKPHALIRIIDITERPVFSLMKL